MDLGSFRRQTQHLPNDTPFISTVASSCVEDGNVVVNSIAPAKFGNRTVINIVIDILTDDIIEGDREKFPIIPTGPTGLAGDPG